MKINIRLNIVLSMITCFVCLVIYSHNVCALELAISIDDAPRADGPLYSGKERAGKIIEKLDNEKIQAVFFVNPEKFSNEGYDRVMQYSDAGHLIANHGYSHLDLDKVSPDEFIKDIKRADRRLAKVPTFRKWFRFPYLHEGNSIEVRDKVRMALRSMGYKNGYVTIDTYDWYFDKRLQQAIQEGDKIAYKRLEKVYIQALLDGVEFYDHIAQDVLGRSPRHVILLHENDILANFLDSLIKEIHNRKWTIVKPDEAYQDQIAEQEPDTLLLRQGRVVAIASVDGYKGSIESKWEDKDTIDKELKSRRVFK